MTTTDWPALVAGLVASLGTQQRVAERLDVPQSSVSRWLNGARKPLGRNARTLRRLADEVGITTSPPPPIG